jgi:flavin-dependent dehydrogenase
MSAPAPETIVIVGGGPAGAAAACLLGSQGHTPLVLERDAGPRDKICGEFISGEAQDSLAELGIDPRALGGAAIGSVRLVSGRDTVESQLPFEGIGLTRRRLDEVLLRRAEACGARIRRGVVARAVVPSESALEVRLRGEPSVRAATVLLATGKHDLHEPKRPAGPSGGDLVGFKTYWTVAQAERATLEGAIEIVLFDGGYAGLQCVEDDKVNLCLLVRRSVLEAAGRRWDGLIGHLCRENPHLERRLGGAQALLPRPLTISNVPYGYTHQPRREDPQGLFRLGDQMGVIPSFCGDGIAIALHTARLAAKTFAERGNAASAYHDRAKADVRGPIGLASRLYDVSRSRLGRSALMAACRMYPGLLGTLAARTRVRSPGQS